MCYLLLSSSHATRQRDKPLNFSWGRTYGGHLIKICDNSLLVWLCRLCCACELARSRTEVALEFTSLVLWSARLEVRIGA